MPARIPTYRLHAFAGTGTAPVEVFFPDYAAPRPRLPMQQPYRGDYYKISLCLRGQAGLLVNLNEYAVAPGCLVLATPDVIKQWTHVSDDYETLSVFFTKEFIASTNAATSKLGYLVAPPAHVLALGAAEAASIAASLRFLQQKYAMPNAQRDNIVRSILVGLLYELGALYAQAPAPRHRDHARRYLLAASFRQLVQAHCTSARSVAFYAAQLCITPKHLSELVKEATGKTAGDWIAEAVVLEAKALLQNPALAVQQVAASLQFADQFAFSRFFKKSTGLSPTAYRRAS